MVAPGDENMMLVRRLFTAWLLYKVVNCMLQALWNEGMLSSYRRDYLD